MQTLESLRLARPRRGRVASAVMKLGVSARPVTAASARGTPTFQPSRLSRPVHQVRDRVRVVGEGAFVSPRQNLPLPDSNSPSVTVAKLGVKREMVEDASAQAARVKETAAVKSDVNASAAAGPAAGRTADDSRVGASSEQRNVESSLTSGASERVERTEDAVPADSSLDRQLVIDQFVSQVETSGVGPGSHPAQTSTEATVQHLGGFDFCALKEETVGEGQAVSHPLPITVETTVQYQRDGGCPAVPPGHGNPLVSNTLNSQKTASAEHQAHDRNWLLQQYLLMGPQDMADSNLMSEIRFPGILRAGSPSPTIGHSSPQQPGPGMLAASGFHNVSFPFACEDTQNSGPSKDCNKGEVQGISGTNLNPGTGGTADLVYHFFNGDEAYDQGFSAAVLEDSIVTTPAQKSYDPLSSSKPRNSPARSSYSSLSPSKVSGPQQKLGPGHVRKGKLGVIGSCLGDGGVQQPVKNTVNHNQSAGYKQRDPGQCSREYQPDASDCQREVDQRASPAQYQLSGRKKNLLQQVECCTDHLELADRYRSEIPNNLHPAHHLVQEHRGEPPTLYSNSGTGSIGEMPTSSTVCYTELGYPLQAHLSATHVHNFLCSGVNEGNGRASLPGLRTRFIFGPRPGQGRNASIQSEAHPVSSGSDCQLHDGCGHVFPFFPQVPGVEGQNRIMMTVGPNSGPENGTKLSHTSATETIGGVANVDMPDRELIAGQPLQCEVPRGNLNQWLPTEQHVAACHDQSSDLYNTGRHPQRPYRRHGKLHSSPNSRFVPFPGSGSGHHGLHRPRYRPSVGRGQDSHQEVNPGDGCHTHSCGTVSRLRSLRDPYDPYGLYSQGELITLPSDLQNQADFWALRQSPKEELVDNGYTENHSVIHPMQLEDQHLPADLHRSKLGSARNTAVEVQHWLPEGVYAYQDVSELEGGMPLAHADEKITSSNCPNAFGFWNACDSLYPPDVTMSMLQQFELQDFPMWIDYSDEMKEMEALLCEGLSFSVEKRSPGAAPAEQVLNEGMSLSESFEWTNFGRHMKGEPDIMPSFLPPKGITADLLVMRKKIYEGQLNEIDDWYMDFRTALQNINRTFDASVKHPISKCYAQFPLSDISRRLRRYRDGFVQHLVAVKMALGEDPKVSGFNSRRRARKSTASHAQKERLIRNMQLVTLQTIGWRPHRGLPDRAVAVLKAWLFANFLHPYPKDSDKEHLAKVTGLTRGQVSNWFINARVRVWKPMVEDMCRYEHTNGSGTQVTVVESVKREVVLGGDAKKPLMLKALLPDDSVSTRPHKRIHRSFSGREQNGTNGTLPPVLPCARTPRTSTPPPLSLSGHTTILPPGNPPTTKVSAFLPLQTLNLMDGCKLEIDHRTERSIRTSYTTLGSSPARDSSSGSSDVNLRAFAPRSREVLGGFLTSFEVKAFWTEGVTESDPSVIQYMVGKCSRLSSLGLIPSSGPVLSEPMFLPPAGTAAGLSQNPSSPRLRIANRLLAEPGVSPTVSIPVPKLLSPDELARMRKGKCSLSGVV